MTNVPQMRRCVKYNTGRLENITFGVAGPPMVLAVPVWPARETRTTPFSGAPTPPDREGPEHLGGGRPGGVHTRLLAGGVFHLCLSLHRWRATSQLSLEGDKGHIRLRCPVFNHWGSVSCAAGPAVERRELGQADQDTTASGLGLEALRSRPPIWRSHTVRWDVVPTGPSTRWPAPWPGQLRPCEPHVVADGVDWWAPTGGARTTVAADPLKQLQ